MAGKFRLEFHHISAFGRFKGRFEDVLKFYRHIIGDDVQIVTALREPTQQYVSWVLVYKPLLYHSSPPHPPAAIPDKSFVVPVVAAALSCSVPQQVQAATSHSADTPSKKLLSV